MSESGKFQYPVVIAKELLIAMIEKGYVDQKSGQPIAESIGEMYQTLLKYVGSNN